MIIPNPTVKMEPAELAGLHIVTNANGVTHYAVDNDDYLWCLIDQIEDNQNKFCRHLHTILKKILGEDKLMRFNKPIKAYGKYVEFDAIAVCRNILMCHSKIGWCDKPVQPYYGMYEHFMDIYFRIHRHEYTIEDNPIKDDKLTICV